MSRGYNSTYVLLPQTGLPGLRSQQLFRVAERNAAHSLATLDSRLRGAYVGSATNSGIVRAVFCW